MENYLLSSYNWFMSGMCNTKGCAGSSRTGSPLLHLVKCLPSFIHKLFLIQKCVTRVCGCISSRYIRAQDFFVMETYASSQRDLQKISHIVAFTVVRQVCTHTSTHTLYHSMFLWRCSSDSREGSSSERPVPASPLSPPWAGTLCFLLLHLVWVERRSGSAGQVFFSDFHNWFPPAVYHCHSYSPNQTTPLHLHTRLLVSTSQPPF